MRTASEAISIGILNEISNYLQTPGMGLVVGVLVVWLFCRNCPYRGKV